MSEATVIACTEGYACKYLRRLIEVMVTGAFFLYCTEYFTIVVILPFFVVSFPSVHYCNFATINYFYRKEL